MTLINLTEKNKKENSLFGRYMNNLCRDFYYAIFLFDLDELKKYPLKRNIFMERTANILMYNLMIKKLSLDYFDEDDGVSLSLFDKGMYFPIFEIKDNYKKILV